VTNSKHQRGRNDVNHNITLKMSSQDSNGALLMGVGRRDAPRLQVDPNWPGSAERPMSLHSGVTLPRHSRCVAPSRYREKQRAPCSDETVRGVANAVGSTGDLATWRPESDRLTVNGQNPAVARYKARTVLEFLNMGIVGSNPA
jgi:hypothetical protein